MGNPVNNTMKLLSKISGKMNMDGLQNVLTGLGLSGYDKRLGGEFRYKRFSQTQLEHFHDASDIAKIAVNKIPSLGTKKWLNHKVDESDGGKEMANMLADEDKRLKTKKKFRKAWQWARLYGGSGIYLSVLDGLDPKEPLNLNRIQRVNSLTVLHRWDLYRGRIDRNIDSPNYGLPEYYRLSAEAGTHVPEIHHSRIIRFDGVQLSEEGFKRNDYWADSVLTVLHDIARDYESAYNGVFNALQDFDVNILKIRDFADICAGDDDDLLTSRLKLMQLSKSIMSSIAIDADSEDFEKLERQFTNLDKVLDKCDKRLQMVTGLPHTVLFGEGSTGQLGASGESEQNTLNELISGEQDETIKEPFEDYSKVIQAQKQGPTRGKILESWSFGFNKLNEPTEQMVSETRLNVAKSDEIYLKYGALSPDEISKSRFGGDEYSMETTIDMDSRDEQNQTNQVDPDEAENELNSLKK